MIKSGIHFVVYSGYALSKITGLAPVSMLKNGPKLKLHTSRRHMAYSMLVSAIVLGFLWPILKFHYIKLQTDDSDRLSLYSDIFKTCNNVLIAAAVILCIAFNRNNICCLVSRVQRLDNEFRELNIEIEHEETMRNIAKVLLLIYSTILITLSVDYIIFAMGKGFLTQIYWVTTILAFLIETIAVYQFIALVYAIFMRFKQLNKYISNISTSTKQKKMWIHKKNNYVSDVLTVRKQYEKTNKLYVEMSNEDQVKRACMIHNNLCYLSKNLNSIYSLHILFMTNTTFIVMVTQMYCFYLMLSPNTDYILTYEKVWTTAIWAILFSIQLYTISYSCTKVKEEADFTNLLLYKINPSDERMRLHVEMFSLQLMHQNIEFTACGFFPIDFTTIYMIVGAVTTYLVFLIQFEMANRDLTNHIASMGRNKTM